MSTSPPIFSRPADPVINRNPFRSRRYQSQPVLPFSEVKELLPVPVFPDRPLWQEMYWRAWESAWSNLHRPKADSSFVANFIATSYNVNMFMWDSAFMVQYGIYGRRAFDFLGTLDNFYAKQHDDGFICREINTDLGTDFFYPFDPNGTGPNILAWAEWRCYRQTGDDERLAQVFWPLLAYHRWCRTNRTWPNGLYWATGLSSGMHDQTRIPGGLFHHGHWSWVDANMQAVLSSFTLGKMAILLGEEGLAKNLTDERLHLQREINATLWNEEARFYQDVDADGRFSLVKSIGAYWALLSHEMISGDRLDGFLSHLRESAAFNRPHRTPSQSADSKGYDEAGDQAWRGNIWSPTNFMLLKGLHQVGRLKLAHEIAVNHLENVATVFEHTDTLWSNYAPETAEPGRSARPDYVGWTGLTPISILLENIIGLHLDWPQRRLTWDRRWLSEQPYGVRNYPLGPDGSLDIEADNEKVTLTTDVPFTLIVQDAETSLQTAVPIGLTEITL